MKSSRKKCRHILLNLIKRINKSFQDDDWFNGCYYVRMVQEYRIMHYPSYGDMSYVWVLAFIDKKNPLNTYLFQTERITEYNYNNGGMRIKEYSNSDHIMYDISQALNSWIQFCDNGSVGDSPSHCNFAWTIDEKCRNNLINSLSRNLPKNKAGVVSEIIDSFATDKSIVYTRSKKSITFDNPVKIAHADEYKTYAISGYSWTFNNSINLFNSDNKLLAMILKVSEQFYIVLFDKYPKYKEFRDRDVYPIAYKIDKNELVKNQPFTCWLALNGYNIDGNYSDNFSVWRCSEWY